MSAAEFLSALKAEEKMSVLGGMLGEFAYLNMVTQMKNKDAMAFYQNISEKLTDYSKPTIFFSLEINRLPDAKIKEWLEDKRVAFYKPWLDKVRRFKNMNCPKRLKRFCTKSPSLPVRLGYACMKKPRRAWSLRLTAGNTTTPKSASCC